MDPIKMTRAEYQAKYGVPPPAKTAAAPVANIPSVNSSSSAAPASTPIKMTKAEYQAKFGTPPPSVSQETSKPTEEDKPGFLKSLVSAPLTILARPIQAGAELFGASAEDVDKFSKEKLGGFVAPVPRNAGDVEKDVGRAVQTVALGTGAPIAGGAAFGLGSSLEQGNDLFSTQTLFNTVLGAGAGKVLDLVGKPLLNAAGKVVGTITPKVLKDVAAGGADAITKFAANHELLGGIAKPLSEKIATGAEAIDESANKLFKGTGSKLKETVTSQYPGLSKENLQNRYLTIEKENFAKPTTENAAAYRKATDIYKNAESQGTNLSQEAVNNGVTHDKIIEGGKYNTVDTADSVSADAMKTSHDLMRPALAAAESGVERVPISEVRANMIREIDNIPKTQVTDAERATMKARIAKEYADDSAAALAHPQGYSLTDLHDNKISTGSNGKYRPNGTMADNLRANQSRQESSTFRKLLEDRAPADLKIKDFNKAIQQKFQLADYLEALHGKKVPLGVVQKAVDLLGKVTGATIGSKLGGGLGGVAGYHLGGVLFDSFERLPNPLKAYYLNSIEKTQPAIFDAFKKYLGDQETIRLLRFQLKAGDPLRANYPQINLGPAQSGPANIFGNDVKQNSQRLFNTPQLSAPGERIITPNTQGTPNITSGTYGPGGDQGRVGGQGQRIGAFYKPKGK